jgi:hypothetical protein
MQAGTSTTTIVAADSPDPATIVVPGPPTAPHSGQTAYQSAQHARKLKAWQAKRAAEVQAEAAKTRGQVSAWLDGLQIAQKIRQRADPPADGGSLAAESAVAASAQIGLVEGTGHVFGSRRVIVLFCNELRGALPAGELTGDNVIAVTSYLPTAADASVAQAALPGAGAAQAAVLGPEVTASQMAALVTIGLSQGAEPGDSISEPVLFGNDSYALSPAAIGELTQLPRPGRRGRASGDGRGRPAAGRLAVRGAVNITQGGRMVDIATAHGSVRTTRRPVGPTRATAPRRWPTDPHRAVTARVRFSTFTERPVASPHKAVNMATTMALARAHDSVPSGRCKGLEWWSAPGTPERRYEHETACGCSHLGNMNGH